MKSECTTPDDKSKILYASGSWLIHSLQNIWPYFTVWIGKGRKNWLIWNYSRFSEKNMESLIWREISSISVMSRTNQKNSYHVRHKNINLLKSLKTVPNQLKISKLNFSESNNGINWSIFRFKTTVSSLEASTDIDRNLIQWKLIWTNIPEI